MSMKFRIVVSLGGLALALTACSFAEDITPPPGYVSPTPAPTLGPLHPSAPPSPARGLAIFSQGCAPCHGDDGLGNGPMAARMPVAVPAIGLRDISSQASPADWFAVVTQGRIDRGMPGFVSLTDAEKWDVLAYVFSLSSSQRDHQQAAALYAANCSECHGADGRLDPHADLAAPAFMAQATGIGMYRVINGQSGSNHPFSGQFSDEQLWSLAGYVRSLAFDLNPLAAVQATPTPEAAATAGTAAETTPAATLGAETSVTPVAQTLTITGSVDNASGDGLTPGLVATLHLHDTTAGQELPSLTGPVAPDGSYRFEGVQADPTLAYWISVDYAEVTYNSTVVSYDGTTTILQTRLPVYDSTGDLSSLALDQVHINFDFSTQGIVQVIEIYVLSNAGSRSVIIPTDGTSLPFIELPEKAANLELQLASGSAPLLSAIGGLAMMPTSGQYGIVAFYTLPYERRLEFSHPFSMPVSSVVILVPEGVRVQSDLLTDSGIQDFQGQTFHLFQAGNLASGSTFNVTISGKPGSASSGLTLDRQNGLLIGLAGLGLVLIGAGVHLYLRDRRRPAERQQERPGEDDALGEDRDAILDAIIALDDQYKAGGLRQDAYQKRREELRDRLKGRS
jgi:mono/diheme cytochrome c family protein